MRNLNIKHIGVIVLLLASVSCGHKSKNTADSLLIYTAASLSDVVTELRDSFVVNHPISIRLNMASSGTLARQIEHGGNPDIYLSANTHWAEYVDSLGYVVDTLMANVAYNELVMITPKKSAIELERVDSAMDLKRLLGTDYLAIGNPAHVPAGKYAKQSLDYYQQYDAIDGQLLKAKDIRSALMMVEMGEAALGMVYYTDAVKSQKVVIQSLVPASSHQPICYVASVCSKREMGRLFYAYINAEETRSIWEKHGFKK